MYLPLVPGVGFRGRLEGSAVVVERSVYSLDRTFTKRSEPRSVESTTVHFVSV